MEVFLLEVLTPLTTSVSKTLAFVSMKLQNKKSIFSMIHAAVGVQIQINFNDAFKTITRHLHSFSQVH